jgi:hypothetical protein
MGLQNRPPDVTRLWAICDHEVKYDTNTPPGKDNRFPNEIKGFRRFSPGFPFFGGKIGTPKIGKKANLD